MDRWYALHTKARSEKLLSHLLALQYISVYLPQVPMVRHGRRLATTEPLFPCYLFARFDLDAVSFTRFRWTPGLRDVVHGAEGPAPVDDVVIEHIQQRIARNEIVRSAAHERFWPQDRVRLKGDVFADLDVVFDQYLPGEARARVLIQILGRTTSVDVAVDALQKASALRHPLCA